MVGLTIIGHRGSSEAGDGALAGFVEALVASVAVVDFVGVVALVAGPTAVLAGGMEAAIGDVAVGIRGLNLQHIGRVAHVHRIAFAAN